MTYLTFIDKIKLFFNLLFDFKGILIFSILMIIFTILYILKKIPAKRYTLAIGLSLVLVVLISILTNFKILSNTFDNFSTVFFTGIYFPSIYLYLSTLLITIIALIYSVINIKINKVYKIINKTMFAINIIIFAIILNIVAKDKVDVFSVNSLYTNTPLVGILEISMNIFLIWLGSLFVAFITNSLSDRLAKKKEVKDTVLDTEVLAKQVEEVSEESVSSIVDTILGKEKEIIPATIDTMPNEEVIEDNKDKKDITFNDILNGIIPVSYYDNNVNTKDYLLSNPQEVYENNYNKVKDNNTFLVEDIPLNNKVSFNDLIDDNIKEEVNNYTVNDYKKIIEMLNKIKKQGKSNISVDNIVALSLINNYDIDECLRFKDILNTIN